MQPVNPHTKRKKQVPASRQAGLGASAHGAVPFVTSQGKRDDNVERKKEPEKILSGS
jgi:hypothetical protein